MTTKYTEKLGFANPQAGDCNWDDDWARNQYISETCLSALNSKNRVISGGEVIALSGTNIYVSSGYAEVSSVKDYWGEEEILFPAPPLDVSLVSWWIYVDDNFQVNFSTSVPTSEFCVLALVDVNSVSIVRVLDLRAFKDVTDYTIDAIQKTVSTSAAIVDTFIYDTNKDPDGGAWRLKTSGTSWYRETLNTATRGSKREFPAVALIVAEATKVTIYDATDPTVPMWMVFNSSFATWDTLANLLTANDVYPLTRVSMLFGELSIVSSFYGIYVSNFKEDKGLQYSSNSERGLALHKGSGIAGRNSGVGFVSLDSSLTIVSSAVNDVAMTVLEGNDYPTIAIATNGGVSIIDGPAGKDTVVDITWTSQQASFKVSLSDGISIQHGANNTQDSFYHTWNTIPSLDVIEGVGYVKGTADRYYTGYGAGAYTGRDLIITAGSSTGGSDFNTFTDGAIGSVLGLTLLKENPLDPSEGMVNYITQDYQSGWQQGDIRTAALAETTTGVVGVDTTQELVTNGTFDTDTSGWIASGDTILSTVSGVLKVQELNGGKLAYQAFPTVVGQVYEASCLASRETGSAAYLRVGTSSTAIDLLYLFTTATSLTEIKGTFKAVGTTTYVAVGGGGVAYGYYDNISVKPVQNLVENGEFSSDRAWTHTGTNATNTVTITGGKCTIVSDGTLAVGILEEHLLLTGIPAKVTFNVTLRAGSLKAYIGGVYITISSSGTHSIITSGYYRFAIFRNTGVTDADIDNVSVVELNVPDRSYKNHPLRVVGELTKTAVATGSELVAYSGFSEENYIEQPYTSDLDFGTGDFYVMFWKKYDGTTATSYPVGKDVPSFLIDFTKTNTGFWIGGVELQVDIPQNAEQWQFYVYKRESGVSSVFCQGKSLGQLANSGNVSSIESLFIGNYKGISNGIKTPITMVRIGAGAPSDDQIEYIYNTEKRLFEADVKCTLNGSSNSVTALDYDEDTNKLIVGTSSGDFTEFNDLVDSRRSFMFSDGDVDWPPSGAVKSVFNESDIVLVADGARSFTWLPEINIKEKLAELSYDQDKFGDYENGDYSGFESDGFMRMHGEARPWSDMVVALHVAELHPTQSPQWIDYKGGRALQFSGTADQTIYFDCQLPHSYAEGTDLEFHVHAVHQATETGTVIWELTHSWANVGDSFPTQTTVSKTFPSHEPQDVHGAGSVATLDGTGKKVSSILICSLTRKGAVDTSTSASLLIGVDFNFLMDTLGSREEYAK